MEAELSMDPTPFPKLSTGTLAALHGLTRRRAYGYGDQIDGSRREDAGLCLVRGGRVRIVFAAKAGWTLTLVFRQSGDVFELHLVDGPVEGKLHAVSAARQTVVESMPWSALVRAATPAQMTLLDQQLYRSWQVQRIFIASVVHMLRQHG